MEKKMDTTGLPHRTRDLVQVNAFELSVLREKISWSSSQLLTRLQLNVAGVSVGVWQYSGSGFVHY